MKKDKKAEEKLAKWKDIYEADAAAWSEEVSKMDAREEQYHGERRIEPCCDGDARRENYHNTQTTFELIEAEIDTTIPPPKVSAIREQDERLAKIIEDALRNDLDRLRFRRLNDQAERTCYTQGLNLFEVEWDNACRTHTTIGDVVVSLKHPKQFIPQKGIYTNVEDMDHYFLKLSKTKESVKRRYNIDVSAESEEDPSAKTVGAEAPSEDMVTQYIAYYRNDRGGIGLFSWVNDTVVADYKDYQARRLRHCIQCGAVEPLDTEELPPTKDGTFPGKPRDLSLGDFDGNMEIPPQHEPGRIGKRVCPYCGGKFEESEEDYEEIWLPKLTAHGVMIPGAAPEQQASGEMDEAGMPVMAEAMVPTKIPYYKPNLFPLVLQKNLSIFGQLQGDSDVDRVKFQHNTRDRLAGKILDKLLKAGSFATLPPDATIRTDSEDMKFIRLENPADKAMIDVYDMQGKVEQDYYMYNKFYEEARNIIGITDSFQGRRDATATSGKAKEFSAARAAGRLESKRTMKDEAYAKLYEIMFKLKLAYTDEPRPIHSRDEQGKTKYDVFDRYDFLERDESGEWFWNDQFIFSIDTSAALAANREAMWQETRMNLQSGAFGDPAAIETLVLFWTKMETLHYPDAAATKKVLQERLDAQQQQQAQAMQMQQQQQAAAAQMQQQAMENQRQQAMIDGNVKQNVAALQEVGRILGRQPGQKTQNEGGGQNGDQSQRQEENPIQLR